MGYSAEISRGNPTCFLFLIDQSGSMADRFGLGEATMSKAEGAATAINRLLQNLVLTCAKDFEVASRTRPGAHQRSGKQPRARRGPVEEDGRRRGGDHRQEGALPHLV